MKTNRLNLNHSLASLSISIDTKYTDKMYDSTAWAPGIYVAFSIILDCYEEDCRWLSHPN